MYARSTRAWCDEAQHASGEQAEHADQRRGGEQAEHADQRRGGEQAEHADQRRAGMIQRWHETQAREREGMM